jgi:hypothetical protein
MRISAVVDALAADLSALGGLGDDTTADVARRLAAAMEGPLTARLLEALGQVTAELDASLAGARVELRLVGGDAELVVIDEERDAPVEGPDDTDGDADARITLRVSSRLKAMVEAAAGREGVSVNSYIVRGLAQLARPEREVRVGRRLRGQGRS